MRLRLLPSLLLAGLACTSPSGSSSETFAQEPRGTITFIWRPVSGDPQPYQVRPDGSGFKPVLVPHGSVDSPEVSRDGGRLLYDYAGYVFVMDLATQALRQITTDRQRIWPSWSPDGDRIVSVKFDDVGSQVLRVTEVDRSAEQTITQPLSAYAGFLTQPAFFPSGDSLLYVKHDPLGHLWLAYADGSPPTMFVAPWGSQTRTFALSRNGQQLAAAGFPRAADSGLRDDFTVRIAAGSGKKAVTVDFAPNWVSGLSFSPDGEFLVVTVERPLSGITWLEVLEISTKRRQRITPEHDIGTAVEAKWGP